MTSTVAAPDRPDTHEMVVVHNVFRRFFGDLPGLIRAAMPGDAARAVLLADVALEISTALEHHHTTEDELLWPTLLQRVEADRAFVLRAEEQHERIHELLGHAQANATAYRSDASAEARDTLAQTLTELRDAATEHMADEERYILPLCEQHMSVAEWDLLGERGRASMPKDRLLIQLGWILDGLPALDKRAFLAAMPLIARIAWRVVGKRAWQKERDALYEGWARQ